MNYQSSSIPAQHFPKNGILKVSQINSTTSRISKLVQSPAQVSIYSIDQVTDQDIAEETDTTKAVNSSNWKRKYNANVVRRQGIPLANRSANVEHKRTTFSNINNRTKPYSMKMQRNMRLISMSCFLPFSPKCWERAGYSSAHRGKVYYTKVQ